MICVDTTIPCRQLLPVSHGVGMNALRAKKIILQSLEKHAVLRESKSNLKVVS